MDEGLLALKPPGKLTLQNFRTFQFIAEFFIFSKYGEQTPIFQEFLIVTEMVKFTLKTVEYFKSYRNPKDPTNILLEKYVRPPVPKEEKSDKPKSRVERIKASLENIKNGKWTKRDYQPEMFEIMPNGKKMQLVTSEPIPQELSRKRADFWQMLGELILMIRPVVAIIGIRMYGEDSYVPYFLSLAIELFVFWLQRKITLLKPIEMAEWESRQKDLIWRCLFKRPFFKMFLEFCKTILKKFMGEHRWLFRLIVFLLEIQSSITLTI